ncbi:MAG: aldolase [Candidatus Bathyarchaeia archaeon]
MAEPLSGLKLYGLRSFSVKIGNEEAIQMDEAWREISRFSKKLHDKGYMASHAGNLSIRRGYSMIIKRRGVAADEIGPEDVVEVSLDRIGELDEFSSREAIVHRAIYMATSPSAVVHAHPPYSVACSILYDEIESADVEGKYTLQRIPVVVAEQATGSEELAEKVSQVMQSSKGCVVRAHGTFAVGSVLEEAYRVTCAIESSCLIRYLLDLAEWQQKNKL